MAPCPDNGWQYIDPAGNIQGPFPIEKMRLGPRFLMCNITFLHTRGRPVLLGLLLGLYICEIL